MAEREMRRAIEEENHTLKFNLNEKDTMIERMNAHIDALKNTILQQNEDLKVYKQNESILKSKLAERVSPMPTKTLEDYLPLYDPETKPRVIEQEYNVAAVPPKMEEMVSSSNFPFNSSQPVKPIPMRESTHPAQVGENSFGNRAGMKNKKHCTIDCVFSDKGCEQCSGFQTTYRSAFNA